MSSSKGEPMINRLAGFTALAGLALLVTFPVWGQYYSRSRVGNQYNPNANRPQAQNNLTGATPNSNPGAGGSTNSPTGQSNYGNNGSNPYGSTPGSYTTSQGTGNQGTGYQGTAYNDPYYGSGSGYTTGQNGTQTGSGSIRALW